MAAGLPEDRHDRHRTWSMETQPNVSRDPDSDIVAPGGLDLVVAWSEHDPSRVGEVLAWDRRGGPTTLAIFGRGDLGEDRRVRLERRRPGCDAEHRPPLKDPHVSRQQLNIAEVGSRWLRIFNVGSEPVKVHGQGSLVRNGEPEHVGAGALINVRGRLLLYVVERRALPHVDGPHHAFGEADEDGIVGEGFEAWSLRARIRGVASTTPHVMISGESGAGKELVSTAVHTHSQRAGRPFVSRSAATLPEGLADVELFGNARGFPESGMAERPGMVGEADRGTLFLDEIGDLPIELQPKLLRVLDAGEYHRLGEARTRTADLRVVGATNRPLHEMRPDLLLRFEQGIRVPPLRARREDVPVILRHVARQLRPTNPTLEPFFDDAGEPRIDCSMVKALMQHPLPLNVRQLRGALWQAVNEARPGREWLELRNGVRGDAPVADAVSGSSHAPPPKRPARKPEDIPDAEIEAALRDSDGVKSAAARRLGISRHQFKRLLKKRSGRRPPE